MWDTYPTRMSWRGERGSLLNGRPPHPDSQVRLAIRSHTGHPHRLQVGTPKCMPPRLVFRYVRAPTRSILSTTLDEPGLRVVPLILGAGFLAILVGPRFDVDGQACGLAAFVLAPVLWVLLCTSLALKNHISPTTFRGCTIHALLYSGATVGIVGLLTLILPAYRGLSALHEGILPILAVSIETTILGIGLLGFAYTVLLASITSGIDRACRRPVILVRNRSTTTHERAQ